MQMDTTETVYAVMANIDGATRLGGIYRTRESADARVKEIENFNFYFEKDGDEVWIEEIVVR